jgi:hypothetical protein
MHKSLAVHSFKLSADQTNARARFYYGSLLGRDKIVPMNKSLAGHDSKLSIDQGFAEAQFNHSHCLLTRESD